MTWIAALTRASPSAAHPRRPHSSIDTDRRAPSNLQRNVNSPVRISPTEERRAVNRVDNPDPIGLTELTKFLAEERILWPRRDQRLANQSLDCPVGLRDWCAVGLRRCRNARLKVTKRDVRRQVRRVERELQVISAVHDQRRYSPGPPHRAARRRLTNAAEPGVIRQSSVASSSILSKRAARSLMSSVTLESACRRSLGTSPGPCQRCLETGLSSALTLTKFL